LERFLAFSLLKFNYFPILVKTGVGFFVLFNTLLALFFYFYQPEADRQADEINQKLA